MTALWYAGVQSVDRDARQVRLWIMRSYPGERLPTSYGFFAMLLVDLFTSSEFGHCWRMTYEEAGLLERPPRDLPEGMIVGMHPKNPRQMIEQVEMIRYCLPPPYESSPNENANSQEGKDDDDEEEEVDDEEEEHDFEEDYDQVTRHLLQAEYLVTVTDNMYLSCRADPCFVGHFYWDTAAYDDHPNDIALGTRQEESLLVPLERFLVNGQRAAELHEYGRLHLNTIEQLLAALPRIIQNDPTKFTPQVFPVLPPEQQETILAILAFAKRQPNNDKNSNPLGLLDRNLWFQIFSYLPLHNVQRANDLHRIYLALECYGLTWFPRMERLFFGGIHEVSMRHLGVTLLIKRVHDWLDHREEELDRMSEDNRDEFLRQCTAYGHLLGQVLQVIDDTLPHPTKHYFPLNGQDPVESMRKRFKIFQTESIQDFAENIKNVALYNL